MTLQIEEGKYYRSRAGYKAGPMQRRASLHSVTFSAKEDTLRWRADGSFASFPMEVESVDDLVAEWVDTPETAIYSSVQEKRDAAERAQWYRERTGQEPIPPKMLPYTAQSKDEPGHKFDAGKPRLDLLAPEFLMGTADVLAFGAAKYGERNWENGMSWSRPFAALMRHMWAWWSGQDKDEETGKSHLYHAACCLMFLVAFEERKVGKDDRAKISA